MPVNEDLNMGELLGVAVRTANQYHACQARHQALIDFVKTK